MLTPNAPVNQSSMARLLTLNSIDDFCLFGPPEEGPDSLIGNVEPIVVAVRSVAHPLLSSSAQTQKGLLIPSRESGARIDPLFLSLALSPSLVFSLPLPRAATVLPPAAKRRSTDPRRYHPGRPLHQDSPLRTNPGFL
jgi:hypothetical protein